MTTPERNTLERLYDLLNHAIMHEECGDLQEWFPEREAKQLLVELAAMTAPPLPTTTASADGLNLLKPDENSAAYLAFMRAQLDNADSDFAKRHAIYCRGEACLFCNPRPELEKAFATAQLEISKVSDKPHSGTQRAIYDWRAGTWRVYTRDDGWTITNARDCSEHEAAAVDAGLWVDP